MYKSLILIAYCVLVSADAGAAIRDGNGASRTDTGGIPQRVVATQIIDRSATSRTSTLPPISHTATSRTQTVPTTTRGTSATRVAATTSRATKHQNKSVASRAATKSTVARTSDTTLMSQTRTGAEYDQCKNAYFTCMDQFCQLKNDNYRRCSCSNRVYDLDDAFDVLQQAGEKLTTFTENLDVVGMTAAQATAMKRASAGENALTSDKSASKALLQAIMNSIRGNDASISGKYADLNSINISFDTANAFGTADAGQVIATYNGKNLYSAVYPQCRQAVRGDCNDASLQRAITAYLMAIEQDCNTVQAAIESKQKQMKSAVREGSAMLDLARVENRQKHNSSDFTTCLNEVEAAIISEEVCGANYHKCLDNGEFIDITTGKPITGVERFYELGELLKFSDNVDAANQKLSKLVSNRQFVQQFEQRTKKFAAGALDKCVEQADDVWAEYLDKALLDIYYAQKSKVAEIKQGCFDFISTCYMHVDTGLTAAMQELTNGTDLVVLPDKIKLNQNMCKEYVNSCDNMFDGNIIAQYINNREITDTTAACRAAVKQCFDKFGGTGYYNFYYPYSGLFANGRALDWLTLYDHTDPNNDGQYKSECAKQLAQISSCADKVKEVFGGFELYNTDEPENNANMGYPISDDTEKTRRYGTIVKRDNKDYLLDHTPYPTGVATEIYYQIVDILSTQCTNLNGRFMERQHLDTMKTYSPDNFCEATFDNTKYNAFIEKYGIGDYENMCPRDYILNVDINSWGVCLCWENGGRRSKWGKSPNCLPLLPTTGTNSNNAACDNNMLAASSETTADQWCTTTTTLDGRTCGPNNDCPTDADISFPEANKN